MEALDSNTKFICNGRLVASGRTGVSDPSVPACLGCQLHRWWRGRFNWQTPSGLVAGAAADYQFTRLWGYGRQEGDFKTVDGFRIFFDSVAHSGQRLDDLATFRGKIGFSVDQTFIYVTGGLAVGHVRIDNNLNLSIKPDAAPAAAFDGRGGAVRLGYVDGMGIEHAFSERLSAKVEGLYYNLGSRAVVPDQTAAVNCLSYRAGTRIATDGFLARVGLNYRFSAGRPNLPLDGPIGPPIWGFEGGARYFYSSGSPRETLGDSFVPGQSNSRLIYKDAQAHAGESFARLEHNPSACSPRASSGRVVSRVGASRMKIFRPAINPTLKPLHSIKTET